MVLPFNLDSDGQLIGNNNQTMVIPTAPPVALLMHGQTTVSTGVPIIPSPYIDFIIVNGDDRYMIRCERKAVLENSVELAKIIHAGPNSGRRGDNHFQISNVDNKDFESVIRFLETKFVNYQDHKHILRILDLANRFNCPDLIIHCTRELDLHLTSATVIDIFSSLWYYQNKDITSNHNQSSGNATTTTPGKKSKRKSQASSSSSSGLHHPFTPEDFVVSLLFNALQLIDMHAELVLTKSELTELRFEELEMIVKRDSLQLSSELVLFNCLADWSTAECQRRKLEANGENRRRVLGALCYTPRYLLMGVEDFHKACRRVELLDKVEIQLITDAMPGKKLKNLTEEQSQMLEKFGTPRQEFASMPIHLSDRSNPKNYPKKMRRAVKDSDQPSCWETCGLNCLTVFTCIFD